MAELPRDLGVRSRPPRAAFSRRAYGDGKDHGAERLLLDRSGEWPTRIGTLPDPGVPLDSAKWRPKFPEMFMGCVFRSDRCNHRRRVLEPMIRAWRYLRWIGLAMTLLLASSAAAWSQGNSEQAQRRFRPGSPAFESAARLCRGRQGGHRCRAGLPPEHLDRNRRSGQEVRCLPRAIPCVEGRI